MRKLAYRWLRDEVAMRIALQGDWFALVQADGLVIGLFESFAAARKAMANM